MILLSDQLSTVDCGGEKDGSPSLILQALTESPLIVQPIKKLLPWTTWVKCRCFVDETDALKTGVPGVIERGLG
ncbi:MAG TPA: hypothetical protein VLB46_12500 [Pyrinomonadaceae bacterium]|nr:hypothetical protein [Pyrinomonadaceae bacterium]